MGKLFYYIALILVIAWAVGFWAFQTGGIIHILLVFAVIAIVYNISRGTKAL
jgi:hypothetical protein